MDLTIEDGSAAGGDDNDALTLRNRDAVGRGGRGGPKANEYVSTIRAGGMNPEGDAARLLRQHLHIGSAGVAGGRGVAGVSLLKVGH
ncbi:MAG: hypothetical protein ACREP9_15790 [Candidatus Dormibacteraceae bacterium]